MIYNSTTLTNALVSFTFCLVSVSIVPLIYWGITDWIKKNRR
jgi:hypothetical protein